jgi:hypothetical protein
VQVLEKSVRDREEVDNSDVRSEAIHETFQVVGQDLMLLRDSVHRSRFTEFQWVLASLALAVYSLSAQDRLKMSVTVDMRNVTQERLLGMFALRIPVIIERKSSHQEMLSHVHQEFLRSVVAYRRMDPSLLDQSMDQLSGAMGGHVLDDLTVNYRVMRGVSRLRCRDLEIFRHYSEKARAMSYTPQGMDSKFFSSRESLDCHFVINSTVIPSLWRNRLLAAFRQALSGDEPSGASESRSGT